MIMDILEYFFKKPMSHAILAATALFIVSLFMTRTKKSLSLYIFIVLLFEMIFVSLHFTARMNNIVITKDFSYQVINFGLFLLWMAHLYSKGTFTFAANPMNIPVFIFFVACVFGGYWAPRIFWYYAVEWMSRYGASIVMFYLVVNFLTTRARWNIALYTLLAMMLLTSIYAIMQVKGYDFMSWGRIVNVSTFGNKDFFASFLTYTVPIAIFMAVGARNWFDAILYGLMAFAGMYNIWTGETRGAWVGLMALAVVTYAFEARFGRLRQIIGGWKKQLIFWSAALLIVVIAGSVMMSKHRLDTFKSIFQTEKGTNIIRVYMWWTGARMTWDQPVFGQGLGASHVTYPFFRPDRYHRIGMSHNTDYVHSEELQFLCEQGIFGFSCWLAMLVVFFYMCYRKLKTIDDISERYTLFGIAGAFFAAVVHDSMNVNLRWTSSMIAFWYVLGLGTRYCMGFEEPDDKQILRETRRRVVAEPMDPRSFVVYPLVIAGFAFMFYGQYRVLRGDWALKATEESGGQSAINKGLDTLAYNPYSHSAYYKVAFHYLNDNDMKKALSMYDGLLQIAPNYAQTHQNTGLIHYRLFTNTNQRKYLYQSLLEFEWATTLENNYDNHTKLLQLYTQLMNDSARARYHNQFLVWNSIEDSYFLLSRYWFVATLPQQTPEGRIAAYNEYVRGLEDFTRDYWLYRTDTVRRVGRPRDEVRYAMKMSVRYVAHNQNLLQFAVGTLLSPSPEPEGDLLYLINIVENLSESDVPPMTIMQIRQTLLQQIPEKDIPPLKAYAVGLLSLKSKDFGNARTYFNVAESGQDKYKIIRDGLKKYRI